MGVNTTSRRRLVDRNRLIVAEIKQTAVCKDCLKHYPACVMDFDHLRDKKANISIMSNRPVSVKTLMNELAKCELVCANCHRIRTLKRHVI